MVYAARLMVVIAALIGSSVARAEPMHLLCHGERDTTENPRGGTSEPTTTHDKFELALVIDRSAGTVTVNEHDAKILGNFGFTTYFLGERVVGFRSAISGDAVINIISRTDDLTQVQHFRGLCEPTR
jgi:hypothetical protein